MEPLKEERYKKIRILIVFLLMNLCFYGILQQILMFLKMWAGQIQQRYILAMDAG